MAAPSMEEGSSQRLTFSPVASVALLGVLRFAGMSAFGICLPS